MRDVLRPGRSVTCAEPFVPPARAESTGGDPIEALLDEALAATFPASDPVALAIDGGPTPAAMTAKPE